MKGIASTPSVEEATVPTLGTYRLANLAESENPPDASRFYDVDYDVILLALLEEVVVQEGPIFEELLIRSIARAHGFARSGARIQKRLQDLTQDKFHISLEAKQKVFWPSPETHKNWCIFREPGKGEMRAVDEIPLEELKALAVIVSKRTEDSETALRMMAKHCGINRITESVRARFGQARE